MRWRKPVPPPFLINQLREKIGVFFGNPETTTGGKALKFYASVRMDIRRIRPLRTVMRLSATVPRSRLLRTRWLRPFKTAEFDVLYGEGISKEGSVLDMALQANVVKKSGSWFTYEGDQLGQGRENVRQFLKDNPELTEEIENKVKAAFGLIKPTDQFAEDDGAEDAAGAPDDGKTSKTSKAGQSLTYDQRRTFP